MSKSQQQKPVHLTPKKKAQARRIKPNSYDYLTVKERAWLAGVVDSVGKITPRKIVNSAKQGRLLTYRVLLRSSPRLNPTLEVVSKLLRLPLRNYSREDGRTKWELNIPYACVDDLMAVLKPYLTAETYNAYVNAKYASELSEFTLLQDGWVYHENALVKPRRLYKGVDWKAIDELYSKVDPDVKAMLAEGRKYITDMVAQRQKDPWA